MTPHAAQNNTGRRSAIDARTTRHRVETPFGWGTYARPLHQTLLRGLDRVATQTQRVFTRYNLMRMGALEAA